MHELLLLDTDHLTGLEGEEAARRLEVCVPNQLPRAASAGPLRRLLPQMHHPLVYVLIVAGIVTLVLREYVGAA